MSSIITPFGIDGGLKFQTPLRVKLEKSTPITQDMYDKGSSMSESDSHIFHEVGGSDGLGSATILGSTIGVYSGTDVSYNFENNDFSPWGYGTLNFDPFYVELTTDAPSLFCFNDYFATFEISRHESCTRTVTFPNYYDKIQYGLAIVVDHQYMTRMVTGSPSFPRQLSTVHLYDCNQDQNRTITMYPNLYIKDKNSTDEDTDLESAPPTTTHMHGRASSYFGNTIFFNSSLRFVFLPYENYTNSNSYPSTITTNSINLGVYGTLYKFN